MIPYGRQCIDADDVAAVRAVLESDFLTQGPAVPAFERALANRCDARFAVAASSATASLHMACLSLGVGPGDIVWTSPITFVASANCALFCGAGVDFVDIDARSYNMCPDALEAKLIEAAKSGRLPKVVIPVHLAGQSCDMRRIRGLGNRYGFQIIEDASHAVGAEYCDQPVGCGAYSDITVFSFHPVKIITTAEGGLALTNDRDLAAKMELLRSHGISRDPSMLQDTAQGGWYYEQSTLGFNYRMTDMQAALGLSQANRLHEFVDRRRALAADYDASLTDERLILPWQAADTRSSYHLYIVRLRDGCESRRRDYFDALRRAGLGVNVHYIPVYLQPFYRALGFAPGHCPNAEGYYRSAVSIPLHPGMTEIERDTVVSATLAALDA